MMDIFFDIIALTMERCMTCNEQGTNCLIAAQFEDLQRRANKSDTLEKQQEVVSLEKALHELARGRGCLNHNSKTLKLPKLKNAR